LSVVFLLVVVGAILVGARAASRSAAAIAMPGVAAAAGPAAASVVNIDSFNFPGASPYGEVLISGVDPLVLLQVPADRWLVITDCAITGGPFFSLVEVAGPTVTTKRGPPFCALEFFHSSVGLAFAPGTQLAIRNSGSDQVGAFTLTGYLVRD